jgi:prevent-host-death family protein
MRPDQTRPDQTTFMKLVNIQMAKTHLSRLVEEAVNGESIVIARAGRPLVKLMPCLTENALREPGDWKGKLWMSDDFDQTDGAIVRLFETGDEPKGRPARRPRSPALRPRTPKSSKSR